MSDIVAGHEWEYLAKMAYRAFAMNIGDTTLEWHELPESAQSAWEAAVRQAIACAELRPGELTPDLKAWTGWKPLRFRR